MSRETASRTNLIAASGEVTGGHSPKATGRAAAGRAQPTGGLDESRARSERQAAEGSVSLRVITSAMAIVGILTACQMAESQLALTVFGIFGTAIGSYVSYRRRTANNFWLKWAIAAGILVVLGFFIEEIIYRVQATIADARAPLTNMLVSLQALHSFDLPRRRDLNISALVGLTLMASAATLSRNLIYGVYMLTFICFGAYMLYLDSVSRTVSGAAEPDITRQSRDSSKGSRKVRTRLSVAVLLVLAPLISLAVFMVTPRLDIRLLGNVRVSVKLNLPFLSGSRISNPLLLSARRGDGSLVVNPQAYHGFNEELDLNYRGKLSDDVVLKVACPKGEFWRAMAFDTYDGKKWTMSRPRKTYDRLTAYGAAIQLAPIPSLVTPRRVPVEELGQVFYLEQDQPNIIPAAAVPNLIYFPTNKVLVDSYGSLRSPVLMEKDMVYTVFSQVPRYSFAALRATEQLPDDILEQTRFNFADNLQLPEHLPPEIPTLAHKIAGEGSNWFNQADRINLYLQRNYTYNLDVPPTPEGKDCIADFLFKQKAGYCEHFSTAFVILCRCQGIPARLVTGFRPGRYNPFTGLWDVQMQDAHAWAEVFLPRWGWVQFDPTPDGAAPAFNGLNQNVDIEFIVRKLSEVCSIIGSNPLVKHVLQKLPALISPMTASVSAALIFVEGIWQPAAFAMGIVGIAALIAWIIEHFPQLRRRSIKRSPTERETATGLYLELCRSLGQLDIERARSETGDALAMRARQELSTGGKLDRSLCYLIDQFVEKYSRCRFGRDGNIEELAGLSDTIREALAKTSAPRQPLPPR